MHTFSIHFVYFISFTSLFIKSNNNSCNFPLNIFFSIHNNLSQPILTSLRISRIRGKIQCQERNRCRSSTMKMLAGIELNVWLAWLTSSDEAEPGRRKNDEHRYYYYYYFMRCTKSSTKYKIHS